MNENRLKALRIVSIALFLVVLGVCVPFVKWGDLDPARTFGLVAILAFFETWRVQFPWGRPLRLGMAAVLCIIAIRPVPEVVFIFLLGSLLGRAFSRIQHSGEGDFPMTAQGTLVIADDHPLFRKGLREMIESDPTLEIVGEAGDGETALKLIRQTAPGMVILDIDMPRMGGLGVAREMTKSGLDADILFLTMVREEDLFHEAMDVGARAYVLKDSAATEILNAIHTVADGKYFISPALSDHLMKRTARAEKLLRHTPSLEDLTPAELRILRLVAENRTSKEIAGLLSVSYKTVENHRTGISSKLHLRGSHSLLKFAIENKNALAGQ